MDVSKFRFVLVAGGAALVGGQGCVLQDAPADGGGRGGAGGETASTTGDGGNGSTAATGGDGGGSEGGGGEGSGAGGQGGHGGDGGASSAGGAGGTSEGGGQAAVCADECVDQAHGADGLCTGFPCCWAAPACCTPCCPLGGE